MSLFYHEEPPNNSSKSCKFLSSTLKEAFSHCQCHNFRGRRPSLSEREEDDDPTSDFDHEQEEVVSEIRTRAMEAKSKRKANLTMDSFFWVCSPTKGELLFINPNRAQQKKEDSDGEEIEEDEFFSAGSCFTRSSSCTNMEAFFSVKTIFSRCSSLNGIEFQDFWRGSIIKELCHCEGWPFGLCRKALLLPPLPKSPSESWLWRKRVFGTSSIPAFQSQKN